MKLILCAVALAVGFLPSFAAVAKRRPKHPFQATAYSRKGRTASGTPTRRGTVAADPRLLPKGSVVQVKGAGPYSGRYKVTDTGSSVKGHKIDIYLPDSKSAQKFGKKNVQVKVVKRARAQ